MRAIVYSEPGDSGVLRLTERAVPERGPGEVGVRVHVSGVNPTDWKQRSASRGQGLPFPELVPNQDGAGVVDAVGPGVPADRVGERVWLWEASWQRADGTAQEYVVLPEQQAVPLPGHASFDLGASLGIPALTAHRCLTLHGGGRLVPGSLTGRTVLVAGGAGAVGNAAIQLARWAGATVVTTVSGREKAALARAASADTVVNYRSGDPTTEIRQVAPDGVDVVVEVAPAANAALNAEVLGIGGTVGGPARRGPPVAPRRAGCQDRARFTVGRARPAPSRWIPAPWAPPPAPSARPSPSPAAVVVPAGVLAGIAVFDRQAGTFLVAQRTSARFRSASLV